jgi:hypothetical protein
MGELSMFPVGTRWKVPIVPGRDGVREPVSVDTDGPRCVACCHSGQNVIAAEGLILCVDASACTNRYRDGRSPEQFAADLQAEALTSAQVPA